MTRLRARLRRAEGEWTRNSIKRRSFALIRVIRGQICFSLLFPGGTRCLQRVGKELRLLPPGICAFEESFWHRLQEKSIHL
jgi:hypothetical protein